MQRRRLLAGLCVASFVPSTARGVDRVRNDLFRLAGVLIGLTIPQSILGRADRTFD
jgi:hypothetical protein